MTNRIANGPPPGFAPFTHVIRLESVGVFQCPAVPMVPPAIILPGLEYLELLTGGVVLDDSEREYGPGTLFWHLPGEPTVHRTRPEAPYRCLCVQFAVTAPRRQVPRRTMAGDGIWARALTDELLAAFHDARCDRDALALYAYGRLLWAAKTAPPEAADSGPPAPLRRLLHLLEGRPDLLQAGVAELAAAAGVSRAHLHLLCRKHWRSSPHRLLLERRLQTAKRLLAGGRRPVKAIAGDCGFDNVESFCRAFRRLTGLAPGAYRSRHTRPGATTV